jgi:hypothetical protein
LLVTPRNTPAAFSRRRDIARDDAQALDGRQRVAGNGAGCRHFPRTFPTADKGKETRIEVHGL